MSEFLYNLGARCARHPFRALAVWLVLAAVTFGASASFGGELTDDFKVPGVESQEGIDTLTERFPTFSGASGRIVFYDEDDPIDSPENRAEIDRAIDRLAASEDVTLVADPFDPAAPAISQEGHTAFTTVQYGVQTLDETHVEAAEAAIEPTREAGIQSEITGSIADAAKEIESKEGIGLAVAVIVLLFAFGSVIAMGMPIGTALFGVGIGMGGVGLLAGFTNVPTAAESLAVMIGLGVGIDYALFVVTRHRQHLHEGMSVEDAAGTAIATAGQSVLFAGTTVVIAILGLLVAGIPAITTMGFAVAIVVIVSMLIAVTLLPAFLGMGGTKIDKWSINRKKATDDAHETISGKWAHHVGARPWRYAVISLAVLLACAAPVMALRVGFADDGNAAEGTTQRESYELLSDAFGPGFSATINVVVNLDEAGDTATLTQVHEALSAEDGVAVVGAPMVSEDGETAVLAVIPTSSPQDEATSDLVTTLRRDTLPTAVEGTGADTLVTGTTALYDDLSTRLSERLPLFIAVVVALSFVLLMIVFRAIMVPLKAAIMNLLSIGAAYGVLVAVFQWGWGKGLVGLESTVPINPIVPLLMFAILFGLSMDYEVFLLSRVREEFLKTGDSHRSVVEGLGSTARVITSAALIMISVFVAFVSSTDVTIKMFGLGLAVAVLVDATIVRMVLVPATMALLGDANWWLPRWLDRWLPHLDLEGTSEPAEAQPLPVTAPDEDEEEERVAA
ncbi:MAG: MMPL family transporter [Acidimicrobiales bacterium]